MEDLLAGESLSTAALIEPQLSPEKRMIPKNILDWNEREKAIHSHGNEGDSAYMNATKSLYMSLLQGMQKENQCGQAKETNKPLPHPKGKG